MATPVNDVWSGTSGAVIRAGSAAVPAWRAGKTVNVWQQLGSNTPQDVAADLDPTINPNFIVSGSVATNMRNAPWANGYALKDISSQWSAGRWSEATKKFNYLGGGHAGRYGNEVTSVGLTVDAPAWVRRNYPSGSIQRPTANMLPAGFTHAEGWPVAVHNYNLIVDLPNGDVVQLPGCFNWNGIGTNKGFIFSEVLSDWDQAQTFDAPAALNGTSTGGACFDPVLDCMWQFQGRIVVRWDKMLNGVKVSATSPTGLWVGLQKYLANNGNGFYYNKPVYDTTRNLIAIASTNGNIDAQGVTAFMYWFDPATPNGGFHAWNLADAGVRGDWGFDYDQPRDRYLAWNGGASVKVLTPPSLLPYSNPFVATTLNGGTTAVTPSIAAATNTYSRFWVSPALNAAFAMNLGDEKLFWLPLS